MRNSRFTEEQIAFALQQAEGGTPVEAACRKMGISQATFFLWKKVCRALMPSEVRKLRTLEEENRPLRKLEADLTLNFSRPGRPIDKAYAKSFNARVRMECPG